MPEPQVEPISGTASLEDLNADLTANYDNIETHKSDTANPHGTTAAQIGLGNVDNTADADKPVSTAQQAALATKAPLASPALTGTPTAPTATVGANTTQIANTAFVQAALAALIDAAPGAMDTLNELAAAMGDDPNFATTVTNALAAKAPLVSPALTGTPTAPTAAPGTATTQIATTAFADDIGATRAPGFARPNRNWFWGVVGAAGRMPLALSRLGRLFYRGVDVSDILTASSLDRINRTVLDARRTGYAWGVLDAASRMPLALSRLGRLFYRGVDVSDILTADSLDRITRTVPDARRTGYAWGVHDPAGRVPLGLSKAGVLIYQGRAVGDILDGTAVAALDGRVADLEVFAASSSDIVCWGDSLTEGAGASSWLQSYPQQLAAATGLTVTQMGRGGQPAEQIAARAGGRAALLTVAGNQIPASGPVTVTSLSIALMAYAGGAWSLAGSLAGVPGTLDEDGSGGYTFTRTTAGAAVMCLPGTPFVPTAVYPKRLHIIWLGRNNYSGVTDPGALAAVNDTIKECIASIIGTMPVVERRFLVLGVTSRDNVDEYVGTANYDAKRDLAADLARDYPKQFIDIDAILRANGDGGATDNGDVANGVLPTSLTAGDRIHLNDAGYGVVAAACAARIDFNDTHGW